MSDVVANVWESSVLHKHNFIMEVMIMTSTMTQIYQRTIQGIAERPIRTLKLPVKRYSHPLGMQFAFFCDALDDNG
jgi:hypothetical protein